MTGMINTEHQLFLLLSEFGQPLLRIAFWGIFQTDEAFIIILLQGRENGIEAQLSAVYLMASGVAGCMYMADFGAQAGKASNDVALSNLLMIAVV